MEHSSKRRRIVGELSKTPAWLNCIRDVEGRDETDPDYDPSTLLVPQGTWDTFTPTEAQIWTVKQDRFDHVIVVETRNRNFQILFPHRELRHCPSIPSRIHQANCHDTIKSLLHYGYPVTLLERDPALGAQKPIPFKKGRTYTPGTSCDQDMFQREITLLSIKQHEKNWTIFSLASFDAVTKHLHLSEINSDRALSTLIARIQPRELLVNPGSLSAAALELLRSNIPQQTCWSHVRKNYRIEDAHDLEEKITRRLDGAWPEALLRAKVNPMFLSPIVQLIDYEHRLGERFLDLYKAEWPSDSQGAFTVLHANTPENLELHRNSFDGKTNGTLSNLLNHCVTPFGKLLLKQWMDSPLCDVSRIEQRADWADMIVQNHLVEQMDHDLKKVPDLAKLLQRIEDERCDARDLAVTLRGYRTILKVLTSSRPKFYPEGSPRVECKSLRHPCLRTETGVISNDVCLGGQNHNIWFLTAPNGGGKSTLMRTICIAVIMAQLGCWVPAQSMALTTMKHIFTRMGAEDNICSGESTFYRELKETLEIVHEASESALVMVDELGRGTSSVDGDALALAVLQHFAHRPACIGVFSTHSLSLASEVRAMGTVSLKCMKSRASGNDMCPLFVVEDGVTDDGYGQSCAKAYGIPKEILERASAILEKQREEDTPEKVPTGVWYDILKAEQSQHLLCLETYTEYMTSRDSDSSHDLKGLTALSSRCGDRSAGFASTYIAGGHDECGKRIE